MFLSFVGDYLLTKTEYRGKMIDVYFFIIIALLSLNLFVNYLNFKNHREFMAKIEEEESEYSVLPENMNKLFKPVVNDDLKAYTLEQAKDK